MQGSVGLLILGVHVNMLKPVNCCLPGCTNNNWNNATPKYYQRRIRRLYKISIRSTTLKLNSDNTRIYEEHFEGGTKRSSYDFA